MKNFSLNAIKNALQRRKTAQPHENIPMHGKCCFPSLSKHFHMHNEQEKMQISPKALKTYRHWSMCETPTNLYIQICVVAVTIKQLLCVVEVVTQCMQQKRFRMWENAGIISIFPHAKSILQQHTLHDNINNIKKQNYCKRAHKYMRNVHIHLTQLDVHFRKHKEKVRSKQCKYRWLSSYIIPLICCGA